MQNVDKNASICKNDPERMSTLFDTAQTLMPGGVNSPVRAFQSVGGEPLYITGAQGAYLNDASNRQFID